MTTKNCIVKRIQFFGRSCKIVMQNENGPCPLLAIANVLSLRNELKLPAGIREITQDELITSIVDLLLERSKHFETAYAADYQQNISEIFPVLQKLTTGVDVNVKFHNLHAFEPTPEVAVFDLLGIALVHGWLVDPQDATTAAVFGNKSYNELVEMLFLVLGDEEMEALSTGPLRNLSITSHHMHSFSNTGSPSAALRTPSALTAPGSRNQSFAASTAHTADLQKALQSLSMRDSQQQQQQQQRHSAGGAGPSSGAESSAGGAAAAAAAAGLAAGSSAAGGSSAVSSTATTLQGQQQGQLLLPSEHTGSSSGAASCQEQRQQQLHSSAAAAAGADDDAIEAIMEEVLHEVCSTAMPGSIELGDSPTHNTILTRRLAYEGAGPSRLNNPGTTGPSAGAAEQPSSTAQQEATAATAGAAAAAAGRVSAAGDQKQQQQQQGNEVPKATAADAAVVRAFMEAHCSQLTPFGLSCMSDVIKEHQLAVFFRNNHFNTLFKYEGAVYLLVTDQGYEYEPDIVWERLDSVQGDTTFCTSEFTPFVPHRAPEAAADGAATYTQVVAGGSAAAAAGGNIAALTDLDAAIAASLAVGDQHSHPGDAVTGSQDHADADYALALQLQLQEEEAAAAARAQQQQQQQPPPQQQQQQQYNRQGSRVSAVQQQEQQQQVQPLESLRQMGQRLASGLQQQYAAATGAAMEQQQQRQQQQQQPPPGRQQQGRRGSHSGGGRRPAQDEKCSVM